MYAIRFKNNLLWQKNMDNEEYKRKYINLRILKNIQEYLKPGEKNAPTSVYPIKIPDELLYQVLKHQGPVVVDQLIHHIFELGLASWSEELFEDIFGSSRNLEDFLELIKERGKE